MDYLKKVSTFIIVMFLFSVFIGYCGAETINTQQQTETTSIPSTEIITTQPETTTTTTPSAITPVNEIAQPVGNASTPEQLIATIPVPQAPTIAIDENVKKGFFAVINLDTNHITIFKDLQKTSSYLVASGKIENGKSLTPSGKFKILNKVKNPGWGGGGYAKPIKGGDPKNPLGHYWIGLSAGKRPGGSIGIHGNVNYASIGTSASHGCIRMHNKEVPILFNLLPIGTPVWAGTTKELTEWGVVGFE